MRDGTWLALGTTTLLSIGAGVFHGSRSRPVPSDLTPQEAEVLDLLTPEQFEVLVGLVKRMQEHERGAHIREALGARRRAGLVSGRVPYGWKRQGERVVQDESEQATIRRIVELDVQGASLGEIGRTLAREGYVPRGRSWYPQTVKNILLAARRKR